MERRLTAIFAADMVGFSRLMEADEVGTLKRQKRHRAELIDPKIGQHGGKIIKLTGDGMIAEFPSVVEAVQCAVSIQQEMGAREADVPEDTRIRYRVAVNLGDVIFDDGDIYGDGVNIAARLEGLADPGGVIVSGTAYDHLRTNIDVGYEDLGDQQVKNIARPIRAYRVIPEGTPPPPRPAARKTKRPTLVGAAILVCLAVIAGAGWFALKSPNAADLQPLAGPRVAILPFNNFGDADRAWFAIGLSEDIITRLSQFNDVQVIARNSSFRYQGKPVNVRDVASELNADYVLEGSVRRSGDKIRITAQLLNAKDGEHIWANTYDRSLTADDLFAVQDDVVARVVANVGGTAGAIAEDRIKRLRSSDAPDLESYECIVLVRRVLYYFDATMHQRTRDCLEAETARRPDFADGWAGLAYLSIAEVTVGMNARADSLERMVANAKRAVELAPDRQFALSALAVANFFTGRFDEAVNVARRAVAANPNDADTLGTMALYLTHLGEFEEGKRLLDRTLQLDSYPPTWVHFTLFHYHFSRSDPAKALEALQKIEQETNFVWQYLFTAVALVELGRMEEAHAEIARAERIDPNFRKTAPAVPQLWWRGMPRLSDTYIANLRAVGVELEMSSGGKEP